MVAQHWPLPSTLWYVDVNIALPEDAKDKISLFCNVPREAVVEEVDVEHSIYEVPLELHRAKDRSNDLQTTRPTRFEN